LIALLVWCAFIFGPVVAWRLVRDGGYKRRPDERPTGPGWERTEERFLDPTTGQVLDVWFCSRTGERAYVRAS
jgi:hypothetical protein